MNTKTTLGMVLLATLAVAARAQDGAREQEVTKQLDALRPGGPAGSPPSAQGEDAVARLVRLLDEGAVPTNYSDNSANSAKPGTPLYAAVQLRALGPLAFDTIYRLLPELGPFGTKNALQILAARPDQRFAPLLEQMLRTDDPARQIAAAELIGRAPLEARQALSALALASTVTLVRAHGIAHAAANGAAAASLQAPLLDALASEDRFVWQALTAVLGTVTYRGEPGRRVLEELAKAGREDAFAQLAPAWVDQLPAGQRSQVHELLQSIGPRATCRAAIARSLLAQESVDPVLADLLLDIPSEGDCARAVARLTQADLRIAPATLATLRASDDGNLSGQVRLYLANGPLTANDAPVLESGVFDSSLRPDMREAHLRALARVAPDRIAARARDLLAADRYLAELAANLLADQLTPQLVPLLVAHIHRMAVDGRTPDAKILDAIVGKSDASDTEAMLDLLPPLQSAGTTFWYTDTALRALERWFTSAQIPALVERWWETDRPDPLIELVSRVAKPEAAAPLVELYFATRQREAQEAIRNGDSQEKTERTDLWLRRLLPTLDGAALRAALTAHLADPSPSDRAEALRLLLPLGGVDRVALARSVLAGTWTVATADTIARMPEVARDAELRDLLVAGVLAAGSGANLDTDAFSTFLEATPAAARRTVATALLDAHHAKAKPGALVSAAVRALGNERDVADAERFRALLHDDAEAVRLAAVEQLARLFDRAAVPGLLEALKDDDPRIRTLAQNGLQRLEEYLGAAEHWSKFLGK